MGKGKEGLKALHYIVEVGRSIVEAASDGRDRPLSLALAGPPGDAGRRDARRLSAPDQGWKDPLVRRPSNLSAKLLEAALAAANAKGLPRYEVLQPEYSLADRHEFEGALADLCQREQIGVITYFSLAKDS